MPDRLRNGGCAPRSTLTSGGEIVLNTARRIQRSRRKGSRLPESAIYVGRPTLWGNPFDGRQWSHAKATILHANWLDGRMGALSLQRMGFCPAEIDALSRRRIRVLTDLHKLAGHDLACWCHPNSDWCHAETLLRLAPDHAELERICV